MELTHPATSTQMCFDFILLLTQNGRRVTNVLNDVCTALDLGIRNIGVTDIALTGDDLKLLNRVIKKGGAQSYLEVVSLGLEGELGSARMAIEIGFDFLLGGTHAEHVLPVIAGARIRYCPLAGRVTEPAGLPESSVEDIETLARELAASPGVYGVHMPRYSFDSDIPDLIERVCAAIQRPVYVSDPIADEDSLRAVARSGAAGCTVGIGALERRISVRGSDLQTELQAILATIANVQGRISPLHVVDLESCFAKFTETWSPRLAGQIGDMQVKLAKFEGPFVWHYHEAEDELFLVIRGQLLMKLRDREETIGPGQFLIVPRGVEHCPVALEGGCEVILIEPASTLNTGNTQNERTVRQLEAI